MHRKELDGLLGNCEMECAVEVMLKKSEMLGTSFERLWLRPVDFLHGDMATSSEQSDLTGFCLLFAAGCIRPGYPNGYFWVDEKLVKIMRRRAIWSEMPDPPGFEEMYGKVLGEYADAANRNYELTKRD